MIYLALAFAAGLVIGAVIAATCMELAGKRRGRLAALGFEVPRQSFIAQREAARLGTAPRGEGGRFAKRERVR